MPAVINKPHCFELFWKTLFLTQKNTYLDFGCCSINPNLSKSLSPSPISPQNLKRTKQRTPETPHLPPPHRPAQPGQGRHTQAKMSSRPTKRQHPTPPKPRTSEQNIQRPTDTQQPAMVHPSHFSHILKFEPAPPSDRSLPPSHKCLMCLHVYFYKNTLPPTHPPTLDKESYTVINGYVLSISH